MNNLEWFTGNEMTAAEVTAMSIEEIKIWIFNIGITENQNADELAREIKALAEVDLN